MTEFRDQRQNARLDALECPHVKETGASLATASDAIAAIR
jgi:hypothetical protein